VTLTVLDGSTFCVSDEGGDVDGGRVGFFFDDTRYLSRLVLLVDGVRPRRLSAQRTAHHEAAFFLSHSTTGTLGSDDLAIVRRRTIAGGLAERLSLRNHAQSRVRVEVALELGADFSDIFFREEAQGSTPPASTPVEADGALLLSSRDGFPGRTEVTLSEHGRLDGGTVRFDVELEPRGEWSLLLEAVPLPDGERLPPAEVDRQLVEVRRRVAESLDTWKRGLPTLEEGSQAWTRAFARSLDDLASLRIREEESGETTVAAGMPWFMTVFGRDTLIVGLQTLVLGPALARGVLRKLAVLQATEDDPSIDAEPGKIVHELRRGASATTWFPRYYGTVDATPLFLILLSELWRWGGADDLVHDLRDNVERALRWIDEHGDRDGDGFVEFERRGTRGLTNHCWKDSGDSMVFHDGSQARGPIASVEVQGYVYDAKLRIAELAARAWSDAALAARLEHEAAELRERFNSAFWCERDGSQVYALALDGDKRPLNALTSNIGHLLWSGIVPDDRIGSVADALVGGELWSGWGVRTLATGDRAYNPLAYHNGTVWPHDNSLIALGLARAGRWEDANRIVRRMLEAAAHFDYELPEVFAGFDRSEAEAPVEYPTSARPQAWAAATPLLLLRVLLGLEAEDGRLVSRAPAGAAGWSEPLSLGGVPAFGRPWRVTAGEGRVTIEALDA
jgi:glycogen debranching enzyme